jgi:hypothetical protein
METQECTRLHWFGYEERIFLLFMLSDYNFVGTGVSFSVTAGPPKLSSLTFNITLNLMHVIKYFVTNISVFSVVSCVLCPSIIFQ